MGWRQCSGMFAQSARSDSRTDGCGGAETKSFQDLSALLTTQLATVKSVWTERLNFYQLQQGSGSIAEWYAKIRGAAKDCKFGADLVRVLRDKFITGLNPGKVLDRLCEEAETASLDALYALALKKENAIKDKEVSYVRRQSSKSAPARNQMSSRAAHTQQRREQSASVFQSHAHWDRCKRQGRGTRTEQNGDVNNASNRSMPKCVHCGGTHGGVCKFSKAKCYVCNDVGHIAKICKKKNRYVNFTECDDEVEVKLSSEMSRSDNNSIVDLFYSNGAGSDSTDFNVFVHVNDVSVKCLCDSGSAISALTLDTYQSCFSDIPLRRDNTVLRAFNGSVFEPEGYFAATIKFRGTSKVGRFYVVRGGGSNILGRDCMSKFKVTIDLVNHIVVDSEIDKIISHFPLLISSKFGKYKFARVNLELADNATPVFCKYRSVPLAFRESVDSELQKLEADGVISPREHSEWTTPLVVVIKNDQTIRLCGDYKSTVNKFLKPISYPLPRVEEVFAKLNKARYFSKIDLKSAYNQIELSEESAKLLSITTPRGIFSQNRMPFGIKVATGIFQKVMDQTLQGVEGVAAFLDDIVISGKTKEEHNENLRKVFEKLQAAGFTLKRDKCKFFEEEIEYLGHVINRDGLRKVKSKVRAILDAEKPANVTEVRSFIGLVNYYAKFIPKISEILHPIYKLLKKGTDFRWTSECEDSFQEIKKQIATDITLAHFNPKYPILVTTDASQKGVSAVLSHVINGDERVINCASRTLLPAEENYSTIQIEALAIYFALNKFYQYLCGNKFVLRCDHKPLITIFGEHKGIPQMASNRLQRWAAFLSMFDYEIQHIKGEKNTIADFLSRKPLPAKEKQNNLAGLYINFTETTSEWPINNDEISYQTTLDKTLVVVKKCLETDKWPSGKRRGQRLVVPTVLREQMLSELHTAHFGIARAKSLARSIIYWPGIDKDIETLIKSCAACSETRQDPPKTELNPWPIANKPFERVHIDLLGPIKSMMYFILTDACTKWIEVFPMKTTVSERIEEVLRETFARFGLPKTMVNDNGPQMVSESIVNFCKQNGIKQVTIPPYHAQSNGAAENAVKTFKSKLKAALIDPRNDKIPAHVLISRILFTYRTTQHSVTGKSPFELMFNGRSARTRLTQVKETLNKDCEDQKLPVKLEKYIDNQKRNYDGRIRNFEPGQSVYVRMYRGIGNKIWLKAIIERKLGKDVYLCKTSENTIVKRHANQISQRSTREGPEARTGVEITGKHNKPSPRTARRFQELKLKIHLILTS